MGWIPSFIALVHPFPVHKSLEIPKANHIIAHRLEKCKPFFTKSIKRQVVVCILTRTI
nr:MAG TPA: hypothetical protein [Inoviridae sp.]